MNNKEAHDMNYVKKCLQDVDLFEENMDAKLMLQYYNAIKNSENTACEEDQIRKKMSLSSSNCQNDEGLQFEESDEELPQIKTIKGAKKTPAKEVTKSPKPVKAPKEVIGFSDMPALSDKLLDIVYHEPQYFLSVNFSSNSYKKLSLKDQVNLLFRYHTNLNKTMASLARQSLHSAPRPSKDIQPSARFSGSLAKGTDNYDDDLLDLNTDVVGIYTSRSGRQVKRKKYTEELEFEDEVLQNKKTKNLEEEEWHSKKIRATDKKNASVSEQTKSITRKEKPEVTKAVEETPVQEKAVTSTPLTTYGSLKKLSNEQIMKRSSLFSPASSRKTRAETMFDKLREDEEKKKDSVKEMEIFEKSLNDVELDISEIDEVRRNDDESFGLKKRPAARKSVGARKRITQEGEIAVHYIKLGKTALKVAQFVNIEMTSETTAQRCQIVKNFIVAKYKK